MPSPKVTLLERGKYIRFGRCFYVFYAIGNFVGIPYCIIKPYRAGLHCGGKVDVAEATRRRRRILRAGFFYIISNLTSKKFKKLVIEIMTHFAYDNFNILMRQYIKYLIVKIKQVI